MDCERCNYQQSSACRVCAQDEREREREALERVNRKAEREPIRGLIYLDDGVNRWTYSPKA